MAITKASLVPLDSYIENLCVEPDANKGCSGPWLSNKSHMFCYLDLNHVIISILAGGERSYEHLVRVVERPSFGSDMLETWLR